MGEQTFFNKTVDDTFGTLRSSKHGLSSEEVQKRLLEYGPNILSAKKKASALLIFLSQFKSVLTIILIVAALISFLLGEINDAVVIFAVVLVNAILGFFQEFKAEKSMEALLKLTAPKATVMRGGEKKVVDAKDLVPGDVVFLEEGGKVPADCRIILSHELKIDESMLTGESLSIRKKADMIAKTNLSLGDQLNMAFMGTLITNGNGQAIVVETGSKTEMGKIASLTQGVDKSQTPLQIELGRVGGFITKATLVICLLVLFSLVFKEQSLATEVLMSAFLFSVALAVAAIPEGLPATVTIALSLGVKRMFHRNVLIRKLQSVETLGSTDVICSDKTGTLTKNEMTVKSLLIGNDFVHVTGVGYEPRGKLIKEDGTPYNDAEKHQLFFDAACLCNNATLVNGAGKDGGGKNGSGKWGILGDPTEGALIVLGEKAGFSKKHLDRIYKRVYEYPFNSDRKMMSTINNVNGKLVSYVKGAPEQLIKKCSSIRLGGKEVKLTAAHKKKILLANHQMAADAQRVLGFAYKKLGSVKTGKHSQKEAESSLVFLGLSGMIDPPRLEVKDAVMRCREAGIRIFVVTGDHGITAKAIAEQIGIAHKDTPVIDGIMLNKMDDRALRKVLKGEAIFARVAPEHKMRVVSLLEGEGHVVAVTGDGVNDAPALKKARIGVAMGKTGTDVSKEAADMVLMDDSFVSIVKAVEEGRTIYANIKKFLRYLFSSNLGEIFTVFFGILLGFPLPILATQILWVNLVTDVFPALALSFEPAEKKIMHVKPREPGKPMITKRMFVHWIIGGLIIAIGTLTLFSWAIKGSGLSGMGLGVGGRHGGGAFDPVYVKALTIAFSTLVCFQLFNVLNCRNEERSLFNTGFFNNKFLLLAIVVSFLLQIVVVQVPFFQEKFTTTALSLSEWLIVLGMGFSIIVLDEIRKFAERVFLHIGKKVKG